MPSVMDIAVPVGVVAGSTAMDATMGEGTDPLNIALDIVGFGAQEALEAVVESAVGGPLAVLIVTVFQGANMLIDTLWDPLASYFNSDLDAMKSQYDSAYRYNLTVKGNAKWPLEVKPLFLARDAEGNISAETVKELQTFIKSWYDDHELITQAGQNQIVKISDAMFAREMAYASYNPVTGWFSDPKSTLVASFMDDNATVLKLLAFAVKKRQGIALANLPPETVAQIAEYKLKLTAAKAAEKNDASTHLVVILCIVLLVCCLCSICSGGTMFMM